MKLIWGLLFFLNCLQPLYAYVISRADSGAEVKWQRADRNLNLFVNPTPVSTDIELDISSSQLSATGMTTSEYLTSRVTEIVDDAIEEWNEVSSYSINPIYNSNSSVSFNDSANSLVFTNDFSFFSSGVLAVTVLSFNSNTGTINSADIIVNQSITNFVELTVDETESSQNQAYLGDIITHEIGHLLGLSHSEVIGSSMIYSVFKNQHTIHSDDHAGINANYEQDDFSGVIEGNIVDSNGLGVFGAHVQLISLTDNEVVQGQLTSEDGAFSFEVEQSNQSYSVVVQPIKYLEALPDYYKNVKNEYCNQEVYVPSFFQGCGGRSKSRPHQLNFDSQGSTINLGSVTVRCDENLQATYLANKYSSNDTTVDLQLFSGETNASFVGLFLDSEISEGVSGDGDTFEFDLSDIADDGEILRVSVMTTGLGSNYGIITDVTQGSSSTVRTTPTTDETGKPETDFQVDYNLSSDSSENIFSIQLYPYELTSSESYEIFAAPNDLENSNNLYHLTVSVGSYVNGEFISRQVIDSYPYDDNLSCLEGDLEDSSEPFTTLSAASSNAASSEEAGFSCATVDIDPDDSGPTGPLSFAIGIMLAILAARFKHYFLSKA